MELPFTLSAAHSAVSACPPWPQLAVCLRVGCATSVWLSCPIHFAHTPICVHFSDVTHTGTRVCVVGSRMWLQHGHTTAQHSPREGRQKCHPRTRPFFSTSSTAAPQTHQHYIQATQNMSLGKTEADFPAVKGEPFWVRKMRTFYRRLDSHGKGYITLDDLLEVASTLIAECPKMENHIGDEIVKGAIELWCEVLTKHVPSKQRVNLQVTEAAFVKNMQESINTVVKEKFVAYFVKPFFMAVDADNDSKITNMEFRTLMTSWKAPPQDADFIFKLIGKAGKLDLADFHKAIAEFFFSEDSKSKMTQLWGILVSYKRPQDYPECNCSPMWEGKMRTMFRRLDVSENGKLKSDDFIQIGRSLATRGHLDKKKTNNVIMAMLNIWVKFFSMDKEGKQYEVIEEKQFLRNLRDMINTDFRQDIDQLGWSFFKAVEVDGNGSISIQEYRNLQEAWGVAREEADGMFKAIDNDKDGKITFDEYLNAWCEYFCGEDPNSPYKSFFGPIIVRHMDNR